MDISPLNKQIKAEGNLEYCKILAVNFYRHEHVESIMYSDMSTLRNILQNGCVPKRPNRINEGFRNHVVTVVTKSCLTLATPLTVAHQPPLSMGFSRQEYWSGLPFPSPEDLSQPRNWTPVSCIACRFFTDWTMREAHIFFSYINLYVCPICVCVCQVASVVSYSLWTYGL